MGNQIIQFANANSGGAGNIIVTTATNLINLKNTNSLVPLQNYQFNYEMVWLLGGTIGDVYLQNGFDTFIIQATSTNTFSTRVNSVLFPNLIINFTFDIPFGWTPTNWFGWITNITDTSKNIISIGGDYRFLKWRRWNDGVGNFNVRADNGNAFIDFIWCANLGNPNFDNIVIDNLYLSFFNTKIDNFITRSLISNSSITNTNIQFFQNNVYANFVFNNANQFSSSSCNMNDVQTSNITAYSLGNTTMKSSNIINVTQLNLSDVICNNADFTNITIINLASFTVSNVFIQNLTQIIGQQGSIKNSNLIAIADVNLNKCNVNNYVYQNSNFTPIGFGGLNVFTLSLEANQCTIRYQQGLDVLPVGTTNRINIPKGFKLLTASIISTGVAGLGTIQIGTPTYPSLVQAPIVANVIPAQQFNTDLTTLHLINQEPLSITLSQLTVGSMEFHLTFASNNT
jgi:hypothetical protein